MNIYGSIERLMRREHFLSSQSIYEGLGG